MNSFHLLTVALENKDKHRALLVLRDKSESVARKICERAGIKLPSLNGKLFWGWVQNYIFTVCKPDTEVSTSVSFPRENFTPSPPEPDRSEESQSPGHGQAHASHRNASAPYIIAQLSNIKAACPKPCSNHQIIGNTPHRGNRSRTQKYEPDAGKISTGHRGKASLRLTQVCAEPSFPFYIYDPGNRLSVERPGGCISTLLTWDISRIPDGLHKRDGPRISIFLNSPGARQGTEGGSPGIQVHSRSEPPGAAQPPDTGISA